MACAVRNAYRYSHQLIHSHIYTVPTDAHSAQTGRAGNKKLNSNSVTDISKTSHVQNHCIYYAQIFKTPQRDQEDFKSHPLNDTPVSAVTFRESLSVCACRLQGTWLTASGHRRSTAPHSSAPGYVSSQLISKERQHPSCLRWRNLCSRILLFIAQHNSTLVHSNTVSSDSRRQPSCGQNWFTNTHHSTGRITPFVTNTLTHVWHAHIWSLHFTQPPPRGTPRPSIQQHPVLTFEDVCTEAVKDEDEVLFDNHILLFSVTISRRHSTRVFSLSFFCVGVDLSR